MHSCLYFYKCLRSKFWYISLCNLRQALNSWNFSHRENMAVVHLFFVDSQFTKYVKNELFGFIEFLCKYLISITIIKINKNQIRFTASTGGLLGLFLGFSFLSFMEIIYFLTLRVGYRWYSRRSSQRPPPLKIHPLDDSKKVIYPFTNWINLFRCNINSGLMREVYCWQCVEFLIN